MPKRKREPNLEEKLAEYQEELHRALRDVKGFERQSLSKRMLDPRTTKDKQERLQREIQVLKTLDLHKTAHTKLEHSLLRIKPIAESNALPEAFRSAVPKAVPPEDKTALHNVTSGLFNHDEVRFVVDKAISGVCGLLGFPVPEKRRGRGKREDPKANQGEEESRVEAKKGKDDAGYASHEEHDKSDPDAGEGEPEEEMQEMASEDEAAVEEALSKYDNMLGNSSDEEDSEDLEEDIVKGRRILQDDAMSISGSPSPPPSDNAQSPISPPPTNPKKPRTEPPKTTKAPKPAKLGESAFLPSLMGGYVSGSESASDVDVAPSIKRLGQRQRQSKWEKKFGVKAKHLENEPSGRDAGWDLKKGAVEAESKKGKKRPTKDGKARREPKDHGREEQKRSKTAKKKSADDEGPLHPSWEAAKAKAAAKPAAFQGKKIVFD